MFSLLYGPTIALTTESQTRSTQIGPHTDSLSLNIKKIKDKKGILKASRKKQLVMYKGTTIRLSADFSTETLEARME